MGTTAAASTRDDIDIVLRIFKGIGAAGVLLLVLVVPVSATMGSAGWMSAFRS